VGTYLSNRWRERESGAGLLRRVLSRVRQRATNLDYQVWSGVKRLHKVCVESSLSRSFEIFAALPYPDAATSTN